VKEGIAPRSNNRRQAIMDTAAHFFGTKGFDATGMRDIASAVGMLVGSLYYHFPAKEALYVAVHDVTIEIFTERVTHAIAHETDPWERLRLAAVAHLEEMIDGSAYSAIFTYTVPEALAGYREALTRSRDRYEKLFEEIIAGLDLPADVDPKVFRRHLLSALNLAPVWYRKGGKFRPRQIAEQLVAMVRPRGAAQQKIVALPQKPNKNRRTARPEKE
jgi:AcrR family transcriptional regulator